MSDAKKILVTGFEPFGGESINPSQKILESLNLPFADTLVLPVDYEPAFVSLQNHLKHNFSYDSILMLGQRSGTDSICLERVALNWMKQGSQRIDFNVDDAFINDLPLDKWQQELATVGKVTVSLSAGDFVCNYIYFRTINELTLKPVLFVHLPLLPEQTVGKPQTPSMDLESQRKVILKIIDLMISLENG
jgi:pyroglutamyl-peptidase